MSKKGKNYGSNTDTGKQKTKLFGLKFGTLRERVVPLFLFANFRRLGLICS